MSIAALPPIVALAVALAVALPATPGHAASPGTGDAATAVTAAVVGAMESATGISRTEATDQGRAYRVSARRHAAGWTFGVGLLEAAKRADDHPRGWLFLARQDGARWSVALDDAAGFADLAAKAPTSVFSAEEKATFAARDVSVRSGGSNNNTGMQLPFRVGHTWTMTQGPHGWGGPERPYSALDLAGGDGKVRVPLDGTMYTMCSQTQTSGRVDGWRRLYHGNGYTTDYYHMHNLKAWPEGSWLTREKRLGDIGTNTCAGGSASGPHVHWGILSGTTRIAWHWRSAGQWVFWEGDTAGGGYALHGSRRVNPGGALYNYGALPGGAGIVDANGAGTINRRSGPGTGYPVVGSLTDGQVVTISCHRVVSNQSGRYGTTPVWNRLPDGTWFSDALAYTGSYSIGPAC